MNRLQFSQGRRRENINFSALTTCINSYPERSTNVSLFLSQCSMNRIGIGIGVYRRDTNEGSHPYFRSKTLCIIISISVYSVHVAVTRETVYSIRT